MKDKNTMFRYIAMVASVGIAGLAIAPDARAAGYEVTNLVSDQPGVALRTDPNLVNPWGLAASATSPLWAANNGTGTSTVYASTSAGSASIISLVVSMPGASPITGIVFNGGSNFALASGGGARFIFASEDGTLNGWNSAQGTLAQVTASVANAGFKGLAIGTSASGDRLYGTDFSSGAVRIFDGTYSPVALGGAFSDPNLPAGYSPFGVRNLSGQLYVTYAVRNPATGDDVAGAGNGIVDAYDLDGNLLRRVATGGKLNSPWGLAIAPPTFGEFSNNLLVGNFGDGAINAYDPTSGAWMGTLADKVGNPISIEGLWAISFGNGGNGGASDALYFTAGSGDEQHGLFGSVAVPEPGALLLAAGVPLALMRRRRN